MRTLRDLLIDVTQNHGGFLQDTTVAELAQLDRLRQVLIRCSNGRFLCAAQDVAHFVAIIERDMRTHSMNHADTDYIRDASLPTSDPAYRGDYSARTFEGQLRLDGPCRPVVKLGNTPFPAHCQVRDDSADYGGAFDGFQVTSDADPGL